MLLRKCTIFTIFFTTFTAFFFPQSHWLLCHKQCSSSPARSCARAALPSLRCWEIFTRSPIIATLSMPISVGLHGKHWEQTCVCWYYLRTCLSWLSGKLVLLLLSHWWKRYQGCPGSVGLADTRMYPGTDPPKPLIMGQGGKRQQETLPPSTCFLSWLVFFIVGGRYKFIN